MHIRIILKFFEKCKCSSIAFFLQSSRYVSIEQSCSKTTGLYDDLLFLSSLFHFFYFIFSVPISFSLCSLISPSLLFFNVLSQAFIKCRKALVYTYINNKYNIYILEILLIFLTKNFMTLKKCQCIKKKHWSNRR